MYLQARQDYIRRSQATKMARRFNKAEHHERVLRDLRSLGVSRAGLRSMEAKHLPHIIHPGEQLGGVVFGMHPDGIAMLVATDRRIIFLDKKPLFINEDEINYFVVSGVSLGHAGWGSTVTLHTRIQDYTIRTFNLPCARRFVEFIEGRCLEQPGKEDGYDQLRQTRAL